MRRKNGPELFFSDEWTLEDEEGEQIKIDVDIHYESGARGKDKYLYPLDIVITRTFKFDGKTYPKDTEFPDRLKKYVTDVKGKFDEWLYDRVNEMG